MVQTQQNFLIIGFPAQSHLNPTLQFAKRLVSVRARVTVLITGLIYTLFVPWAAEAARSLNIPSALLWIQLAAVLDIFYYYLRSHRNYIETKSKDPESEIKLPGLPLMKTQDLPSFLLPSNVYSFAIPSMEEHFSVLEKEVKPIVLVNTFEALESEAIRAVGELNMMPIGPLIPSAFLDGKDQSDTSFGVDIFRRSSGYMEWLDSQAERSVVYVAFGSLSVLCRKQVKEIARALLDCGRPFLWVIKDNEAMQDQKQTKEEDDGEKWRKGVEEKGRIVKWCNQLEVLSHSSVGCFMTRCGWNSSMESIVSGIPMVALPQWIDQGTNAKLIEDVWKTGTRVWVDEEGVAGSEEIRRCLDVVLGNGDKVVEMRNNAQKWKDLAKHVVKEGGSSHHNLRTFINEFARRC